MNTLYPQCRAVKRKSEIARPCVRHLQSAVSDFKLYRRLNLGASIRAFTAHADDEKIKFAKPPIGQYRSSASMRKYAVYRPKARILLRLFFSKLS